MTLEEILSRLLMVYVSETKKLVHATISNNTDSETDETINTTDNHPFYVEGKGWVVAIELEEGDILRTADGDVKTVKNVNIEYLDEPELIYNLEIEGYHTYFVSDENVLVHNDCPSGNGKSDDNGESFADMMSPDEAARYDKYWKENAPDYNTPNSKIVHYKNHNNTIEKSLVIYDEFGRQKYRIDYSNHCYSDHSIPHLHIREYGVGYDPKKGMESRYDIWE